MPRPLLGGSAAQDHGPGTAASGQARRAPARPTAASGQAGEPRKPPPAPPSPAAGRCAAGGAAGEACNAPAPMPAVSLGGTDEPQGGTTKQDTWAAQTSPAQARRAGLLYILVCLRNSQAMTAEQACRRPCSETSRPRQ